MNLLSKSLEFQWALRIYHFHKMFDVGKVWGHLRYKKKSVTFFSSHPLGWRPPIGQEQLYRITSVSRSQLEARRRSNALNAAGDVGELESFL